MLEKPQGHGKGATLFTNYYTILRGLTRPQLWNFQLWYSSNETRKKQNKREFTANILFFGVYTMYLVLDLETNGVSLNPKLMVNI